MGGGAKPGGSRQEEDARWKASGNGNNGGPLDGSDEAEGGGGAADAKHGRAVAERGDEFDGAVEEDKGAVGNVVVDEERNALGRPCT